MNLRKVLLIMTLCFSSLNLIYGMDTKDAAMDDDFRCFSGVPRPLLGIPEEIESSDVAPHEDMQVEAPDSQSFAARIKREISNLNLIAIGYLLESDEATTVTAQQRQTLYIDALNREAEISQLLEEGHCLSGAASNIGRIISYLNAFKVLENFKFPRPLFTYPPYHHRSNPEIGANTSLNLALDALIKNEQEGILICCFHMSDSDIAKSLMFKNKHGVPVEIVTNQEQAGDLAAIKLLIRSGTPVSCPNSHRFEMNHHKFIIFKRNILNKCLVWHGSYNSTYQSSVRSWEDITIDDNPIVIQAFMKRFQEIKSASTPMTLELLRHAK
ncbi:MAG: phospholipase D-like domain-containing protein [bacterium]